jgi:hypothetical protein
MTYRRTAAEMGRSVTVKCFELQQSICQCDIFFPHSSLSHEAAVFREQDPKFPYPHHFWRNLWEKNGEKPCVGRQKLMEIVVMEGEDGESLEERVKERQSSSLFVG